MAVDVAEVTSRLNNVTDESLELFGFWKKN